MNRVQQQGGVLEPGVADVRRAVLQGPRVTIGGPGGARPTELVRCFPFLMRGPSAIQERIDLIPEREPCLPLVGWQ